MAQQRKGYRAACHLRRPSNLHAKRAEAGRTPFLEFPNMQRWLDDIFRSEIALGSSNKPLQTVLPHSSAREHLY